MKTALLAMTAAMLVDPVLAQEYNQVPAPIPHYPYRRSYRTGEFVAIPPYRHPFVVRVYTTPPQQPYYNVPPYKVIAPS